MSWGVPGTNPPNAGSTGPKAGKSHGRNRNTQRNQASGGGSGGATPFPLGPGDTTEFGVQKSNLFFNYRVQNKMLKAQAQMARIAHKSALGGIRADQKLGIEEVGSQAVERGMIGSTVQTGMVEGVKAEALAAKGSAQEDLIRAIMEAKFGRLQNVGALRMGLGELALRKSAVQREMALSAFASAGMNPYGYQTNVSA